eukprot:6201876-Pleurochrysis_carterae.AAC.1
MPVTCLAASWSLASWLSCLCVVASFCFVNQCAPSDRARICTARSSFSSCPHERTHHGSTAGAKGSACHCGCDCAPTVCGALQRPASCFAHAVGHGGSRLAED